MFTRTAVSLLRVRAGTSAVTTTTTTTIKHTTPVQTTSRSISLLLPRRPTLQIPSPLTPTPTFTPTLSAPSPTTTTPLTSSPLDLLPRISTSPALRFLQVRNGPRNTFDPSHFVRKRRFGFLARLRSRTGRAILKRRRAKGRKSLSH